MNGMNKTTCVSLSLLLIHFWVEICSAQSIDMEVVDDPSGEGVSARLKFVVGDKRVVRPRNLLVQSEWWLAEPSFSITPKGGEFEFLAQRGHEFSDLRGGFKMEKKTRDVVTVEIPRSTDMHAENWYSGDHHATLELTPLARWQRADAVDFVVGQKQTSGMPDASDAKTSPPTRRPASKSAKNATEALVASTDPNIVGLGLQSESPLLHSRHGPVLLHGWPSKDADSNGASVDNLAMLMERLQSIPPSSTIVPELTSPWTRDVPILLSTQGIRSVQLLSSVNRPLADEPMVFVTGDPKGVFGRVQITRGKERIGIPVYAPFSKEDRLRFKGGRGVGILAEQLYWTMLESGLRLTPTAGTGFGSGDTYLGYNRTYTHHEEPPDTQRWLQSIVSGRTTITNGPLLRTLINQQTPGSTQTSTVGVPIELDIVVSLSVRDPVDYLDVIFNGETIYSAKLEDHYKRGEFPPLKIEESGWLVVRVVTAHEKGYRYTSTAPFYFEFDSQRRISKKAVQFLMGWLRNAEEAVRNTKEWDEYAKHVDSATTFWQSQLDKANAP